MSKSILVVAGELSGDMHAAAVVRALRAKAPGLHLFGIGGDRLRAEGMDIVHDCREMAVFGLPEVLKRYRFFKGVFNEMVDLAAQRRPDLALLVDYGGFNLRFARRLKALGIKVVYFVCPQVWASRKSRMQQLVRYVDRLLVIFPFEKALFEGTGLAVDFVGHPLVDATREALAGPEVELPWPGTRRLALLPGSRAQEVQRILPVLLAAAETLDNAFDDLAVLVASPSAETTALIRDVLAARPAAPRRLEVVEGQTRDVLRQARAAMVASGTATLEAALMGCPMVVVYKTSWLIYQLARRLIQVPHIGMVNLVAGRALCPEFIQGGATPDALVGGVRPLLADTPERADMVTGLSEVVVALGAGGAAARAAAILQSEL